MQAGNNHSRRVQSERTLQRTPGHHPYDRKPEGTSSASQSNCLEMNQDITIQESTVPDPMLVEARSLDKQATGRLEARAIRNSFGLLDLPVELQSHIIGFIKNFEKVEAIFEALKQECKAIEASRASESFKKDKLQKLQNFGAIVIQSFEGEFDFFESPWIVKRIEAMLGFFPPDFLIKFEKVPKIKLGFGDIEKISQWFSGHKTAVCLQDSKIQQLPPAVANLDRFTTLDISRCSSLSSIKNIVLCKSLKTLITNLNLYTLKKIEVLTQLQELDLRRCQALRGVSELAGCKKLKKLGLWDCAKLQSLRGLEGCEALEELGLSGCAALSDVSALSRCKQLKKLDLSKCKQLASVAGLEGCEALEVLHLSGCRVLSDVSALSRCKQLKKLYLQSYYKLASVAGLEECEALEEVNLINCRDLSDVSALGGCKQLKKLDLQSCYNLASVAVLEGCEALEELNLYGCEALSDVSALSRCKQLKKLDLGGCKQLASLAGLEGCEALEELNLSWCTALSDVSALARCTKFKQIYLKNNQKSLLEQLPEALKAVVKFL